MYHAARVAATAALPILVYVLMALCFPLDRRRAVEATALALFTTGLGNPAPDLFSWRIGGDLVVVETTALRSVTLLPHFAVAYLGIMACLIAVVTAAQGTRLGRGVAWGAVGGLLLAVSHTFLLLPLGLTVAVAAAWTGLRWLRGHAGRPPPWWLSWPPAGRCWHRRSPRSVALRHEMARFEEIQGKPFPSTPSDRWVTWLAVYALLLPFAMLGLAGVEAGPPPRVWNPADRFARRLRPRLHAGHAVPASLQRRGDHPAGGPRGACGLASLPRARLPLFGAVLALAALGAGRLGNEALYLPESDWQAFDRIGRGDVILAGDRLDAAIPHSPTGRSTSPASVETLHYRDKNAVRAAFAADPTSAAFDTLRAAGVNLIITDRDDPTFALPPERFPPACFPQVATLGPLTMYRLAPECPAAAVANR